MATTTHSGAPTTADILEQLRRVPEPCAILMREDDDIVSMGLVERIEFRGGCIEVELVLTDTSCVHFSGMSAYIADVLADLPGVDRINVTASRTVLWTPDRRMKNSRIP